LSIFGRMLDCRLTIAAAACVALRHTQQAFHPSNAVRMHLQADYAVQACYRVQKVQSAIASLCRPVNRLHWRTKCCNSNTCSPCRQPDSQYSMHDRAQLTLPVAYVPGCAPSAASAPLSLSIHRSTPRPAYKREGYLQLAAALHTHTHLAQPYNSRSHESHACSRMVAASASRNPAVCCY
jgi:hypothetical protein